MRTPTGSDRDARKRSHDDAARTLPAMGECPSGGPHAPIPIQGGGGNQCAKCGESC